jgi:hypothetical protein
VTSVARLQVVGDVRHLVEKRVDALGSVPPQHQIYVERDLFNAAHAIDVFAWQHVSE